MRGALILLTLLVSACATVPVQPPVNAEVGVPLVELRRSALQRFANASTSLL